MSSKGKRKRGDKSGGDDEEPKADKKRQDDKDDSSSSSSSSSDEKRHRAKISEGDRAFGKISEGDRAFGKAVRVPLIKIEPNHILSKTEYMRVLEVNAAANKCRVQVLRGDKADDVWEITTPDALLACSTEYSEKIVRVSKTELANRLVTCKDDAFKVVFRPVLSADRLFTQLKELKEEIADATSDAALKKIAKKLLEVPEKTLKGRLMSAESLLGFSLVDDLEQLDVQKVAFRNVNHNSLLSLTVGGIQYVLK